MPSSEVAEEAAEVGADVSEDAADGSVAPPVGAADSVTITSPSPAGIVSETEVEADVSEDDEVADEEDDVSDVTKVTVPSVSDAEAEVLEAVVGAAVVAYVLPEASVPSTTTMVTVEPSGVTDVTTADSPVPVVSSLSDTTEDSDDAETTDSSVRGPLPQDLNASTARTTVRAASASTISNNPVFRFIGVPLTR